MTIRVGLIGYGLGGRVFHAPLISAVEGLELAAIATSRDAEVRSRFPDVATATAEDLIDDPAIDLLVISTPNDTHFPLARAALLAGKHVVVDKPMTTTLEEAEALASLAKDCGRRIFPFHNRRWDGDFLTISELIEKRQLGDLFLYRACWDRFRPQPTDRWRETDMPGAGLLADLGPHLIDQAMTLFGMPEALSANIATLRAGGRADDYFELILFYGACQVQLSASLLMCAPRPRFALHGTGGSFVKFGLDPQEEWLKQGDTPGSHSEAEADFGHLTTAEGAHPIATAKGDYRAFYLGVVYSLRGVAPPPVSVDAAIASMQLIDLARRSNREGCRIATL